MKYSVAAFAVFDGEAEVLNGAFDSGCSAEGVVCKLFFIGSVDDVVDF